MNERIISFCKYYDINFLQGFIDFKKSNYAIDDARLISDYLSDFIFSYNKRYLYKFRLTYKDTIKLSSILTKMYKDQIK